MEKQDIRCSTTPEKSPLRHLLEKINANTLPLPPPPPPLPLTHTMWPPPYLKFKAKTPMHSIVLISKDLKSRRCDLFFLQERKKKRNSCAFKLALHHTWNLSQDICFHSQLPVFLHCILMASWVHFEKLLLLFFPEHLHSRSADSLVSGTRSSLFQLLVLCRP